MEEDEPPGVPEWVVTYGDMMSLLLTFFIMLVSMSEIVATSAYRAVLESLQQRMGYRFSVSAPPGDNFPLNSVIERVSMMRLGSFTDHDSGFGGVRPRSLEGEHNRVVTMPEGNGRRVGEALRFTATGPLLAPTSAEAVAEHAHELRGKPNKIEVRSWIDEQPVETRSERVRAAFDRAKTVRNALITAGVEPERVRMAVVPTSGDADIIAADLRRNGVVTLAVLDAYVREFTGRIE